MVLSATTGVSAAAQPRLVVDLEQEPHHYSWTGAAVELSESLLLSAGWPAILWRVPKNGGGYDQEAEFLLESVGRWWIDEGIVIGGQEPGSGRRGIWAIGSGEPTLLVENMVPKALPVGVAGAAARLEGEPLIFVGRSEDFRSGLWRLEPDSGNILQLLDFSIGWDPSGTPGCDEMVRLGKILVFCADDGLWATDGTLPGTYPLTDLGAAATALRSFTSGLAAFGRLGEHDAWVTDGSVVGTRPLAGVGAPLEARDWVVDDEAVSWQSATAPAALWHSDLQFHNPTVLEALGRPDFFSQHGLVARRGSSSSPGPFEVGDEPWLWNPNAGWRLLADLASGSASSWSWGFVESAARLVFGASTPAEGAELWTSDGTPEGTRLLLDLAPGPADGVVTWSPLSQLTDGSLLVAAKTATEGLSVPMLIPADKPTAQRLPALSLGTASSQPYLLGTFDDNVWFRATSGGQWRVWASQGSAATTRVVEGADALAHCHPLALQRISETLVSSCDGTVLRVVNAGEATTVGRFSGEPALGRQPTTLAPSSSPTLGNSAYVPDLPVRVARLGDRLVGWPYEHASLHSLPLDGSGTDQILLPPTHSGSLVALGDQAIFGHSEGGWVGAEPWITDGTPSGTHRIGPVVIPGSSPILSAALRVGPFVVMNEYEGQSWRTSGTPESTAMLPGVAGYFGVRGGDDIGCLSGSLDGVGGLVSVAASGATFTHPSVPRITGLLVTTPDHTYFTTGHSSTQVTLWRTDCTLEGTHPVVKLPQWLSPIVADEQIWAVDSRGIGPHRLGRIDISSGAVHWVGEWPPVSEVVGTLGTGFQVANNHLFFAAAEATTGLELWTVEADYLFGDGFESGDVSAWSGVGP